MNKLIVVMLSLLLFSCEKAATIPKEKFEVTYNENIETYFLAEILSAPHRVKNKQWEEYKIANCKEYQPIVAKVIKEFGTLSEHQVAIATAKLNDTLVDLGYGNDMLMKVLLSQPEFKNGKQPNSFKFDTTHLKGEQKLGLEKMISEYLQTLYNFYNQEKVGDFFKKNDAFYQGAVNEVRTHIPEGFTVTMEEYYGDTREKYIALVSPMMMWPIEDNEGRGIAATVTEDGQRTVYEIMSPYVRVTVNKNEKDIYNKFGYDYKPRTQTLTIHEFQHSFVNPALELHRPLIDNYEYLFTDSLKAKMQSKGIPDWNIYVIESFVRLGEIRIALMQNDPERVAFLRNYHINDEYFIFLPLLEKKIAEFEENRDKYPKWSDFIPELIKTFGEKDIDFVNENTK